MIDLSVRSGDRKPKIDLLRTCIAALPRLLPIGTQQDELIEMLARLTIHMDHEVAIQAFQSLQYFVIELPEWRKSVFRGINANQAKSQHNRKEK